MRKKIPFDFGFIINNMLNFIQSRCVNHNYEIID